MTTNVAATDAVVPPPEYFDLSAALDRCCDDPDFLAEMIDLLGGTLQTQLTALDAAIHDRDSESLAESAHALKGAVASMTMAAPYELSRELEWLGKSGETTGAEVLSAALHVATDQLLNETQAWAQRRLRPE